jgi:hypothetical protein
LKNKSDYSEKETNETKQNDCEVRCGGSNNLKTATLAVNYCKMFRNTFEALVKNTEEHGLLSSLL